MSHGATKFQGKFPIDDQVYTFDAPKVRMRVIAYWFSDLDGKGVLVQTRHVVDGKAQTQWWYEHELRADPQ